MNKIQYVTGNVLEPIGKYDAKFIVHCVNDEYSFGSGVAGAIAKKWPHVREHYMQKPFWAQGDLQYVPVSETLEVVNLCAQRSTGMFYETIPFRYESLQDGLIFLREELLADENLKNKSISLNFPRIGTGLAKGEWNLVHKIIEKVYLNVEIPIYVYTLPQEIIKYEKADQERNK